MTCSIIILPAVDKHVFPTLHNSLMNGGTENSIICSSSNDQLKTLLIEQNIYLNDEFD